MTKTKTEKLYCYVDETGQDTLGKWFLVAVVIVANNKTSIEEQLMVIEHESKKGTTKWHKTKHIQREKYIEGIEKIKDLRGGFYYSVYENTILFADLLALTAAKAILDRASNNYSASVIVDGLKPNLEKSFAVSLRRLKIRTRKVKGARDESSPLIRLADAMAGLARDAFENKKWARESLNQLVKRGFIREI